MGCKRSVGVFADLGVNQDCAQKNKVAKPGCITLVDFHLSKASARALGEMTPSLGPTDPPP